MTGNARPPGGQNLITTLQRRVGYIMLLYYMHENRKWSFPPKIEKYKKYQSAVNGGKLR